MSAPKKRLRRISWLVVADECVYGIQRAVSNLACCLRDEYELDVAVVSFGNGKAVENFRQMKLNVDVLDVPSRPSLSRGLSFVPSLSKLTQYGHRVSGHLADYIIRSRTDVLHIMHPLDVFVAGRAIRKTGVHCVWEMPSIIGNRYGLGLNRLAYQVACWSSSIRPLANSHATAKSLGSLLVHPHVSHLGVDPRIFVPLAEPKVTRKELGIGEDALVFGVFGRLHTVKGQDRILEAILTSDHLLSKRIVLLLAGGPLQSDFARQLKNKAERHDAAHMLKLIGHVENPQDYYSIVDVSVNNSLAIEPFGLSVVESMLMGVPALVHASGGPAETVLDGITGWHSNGSDVESFRNALHRALDDYESWKAFGLNAREHTMQEFTTTRQAERYMNFLNLTHSDYRVGPK